MNFNDHNNTKIYCKNLIFSEKSVFVFWRLLQFKNINKYYDYYFFTVVSVLILITIEVFSQHAIFISNWNLFLFHFSLVKTIYYWQKVRVENFGFVNTMDVYTQRIISSKRLIFLFFWFKIFIHYLRWQKSFKIRLFKSIITNLYFLIFVISNVYK